MKRTLIPWGPMALDRAAASLVSVMGPDSGRWWYVLPARRGVRKFQEALARHLPASQEPPRGIAQSVWLDVFRPPSGHAIDRREAAHVWSKMLRDLAPRDFSRALGINRPDEDSAQSWWAVGERARDLHVELVQAGLDFAGLLTEQPANAGRWTVWEKLVGRYREVLAAAGRTDVWVDRADARVEAPGPLALIYVPTLHALERQTLDALGDSAHAWSLGAEGGEASFDGYGAIVPAAWRDRHLNLDLSQWFVEQSPRDQAERVANVLADWSVDPGLQDPLAPVDVVVSSPDVELKPYLIRSLYRRNLRLRDGAGADWSRTSLVRLLNALGRVLPDFRFRELATLVRHPAVERALRGQLDAEAYSDLVGSLDTYQREHLPLHLEQPGPPTARNEADLTPLIQALRSGMGPLLGGKGRSLADWAEPLRGILLWVYGEFPLDPAVESDALTLATLARASEWLGIWEAQRGPWNPVVSAQGALAILVGELTRKPLPVTLPTNREGELELLGWHELLWDDARALVLAGFNEGLVPESVADDVLLPASVRRSLGLPDAETRVVRDQYLLQCLLMCRERIALVGGRVSAVGDPLRPSRFAFFRPDQEVAGALQHAFPSEESVQAPLPLGEKTKPRSLPRLEQIPELKRMSVTDFKAFLDAPYLFYLERWLKAETLDDRQRELSPLAFGNLLHQVVEDFGRGSVKDSVDASEILADLEKHLDRRAGRQFGADVLPAVRLQLLGVRNRLRWVAQTQADWAQKGWRIQHVEWRPESQTVEFGPEGAPIALAGRIDRIDKHPTEGWTILDFKTGDKPDKPERRHQQGGKAEGDWVDLQLPLYTVLAAELVGDEPVQLGYFNVGKQASDVRIDIAKWDAGHIRIALDVGREIITQIREGGWWQAPKAKQREPILAAILGDTLVGPSSDGEGDSE